MTIKQYVKKNGFQTEISGPLKRWQTVDIGFMNSDGRNDETQFDVQLVLEDSGLEELNSLFTDFCKENGFRCNTVTAVTIVQCADTYEELETIKI